jgi:hypothetical protein
MKKIGRVEGRATFSKCLRYRYALSRTWDHKLPIITFIMLNPSTATEDVNDPTVERCQRRAHAMGFGTLQVGNIFAWRSTDPSQLYAIEDPIGPENDSHLALAAKRSQMVVCGWGSHGVRLGGRGAAVEALLWSAGVDPYALRVNADGSPMHPLYVGYRETPRPMRELRQPKEKK